MARRLTFETDKRRIPFWRDQRVLGKKLTDQYREGILVVGKNVWTRQQIVDELHCGNFVACQNLSRIVATLDVESLEDLLAKFSMEDLFGLPHFGVTTMFVLLCLIDAHHKNVLTYMDRTAKNVVTLATEKHRILAKQDAAAKEAAAKAATGKTRKRRHAAAS